jgi:hypothetical protein
MLAGSLMILLSVFIFGGLLHASIFNESSSWIYVIFLTFSSTSSLVTGILMIFDAGHYRIKEEMKKTDLKKFGIENPELILNKTQKSHILSLQKDCEKLRPESLSNDHE